MKRSFVLPILTILALGACGEETAPGTPPTLPDEESMVIDVDFFNQTPAALGSPALQTPGLHWAAAALAVTVANVSVVLHTAIPRALFAAAISQTPSFEDGAWHWRFNATHGANTFEAHLIGRESNGNRIFEMRVTSSALQWNDVLLFTGEAPIGGTMGEWSFFDVGGTEVGEITWSHPATDEWIVTFAALAGATSGDTLTYHVDGTMRTVEYFDSSAGETTTVSWDAITHEGYIHGPNYNGGVMACWDGQLANVTCP